MMHPLFDGARARFRRVPRIGDVLSSRPPPDPAVRIGRPGDRSPLLLASLADPTARHFYECCLAGGSPIAWIGHDDLACGNIRFSDFVTAVANAPGIFLREPFHDTPKDIAVATAVRATVRSHGNLIAASWKNTNWSKPLHLLRLQERSGDRILIPGTRVASMIRPCEGGVLKGLGTVPSLAISAEEVGDIEACGPLLVQQRIHGQEVRYHIIGDKAFGCAVESDALDYRTSASTVLRATEVADWERTALVALMESEGLRFAGIDAIRTDNVLYILEINPAPGYHSYERTIFSEYAPISCEIYSNMMILNK